MSSELPVRTKQVSDWIVAYCWEWQKSVQLASVDFCSVTAVSCPAWNCQTVDCWNSCWKPLTYWQEWN